MQDKRRHERIKVDVVEMHGKMSLAEKVEIIDMSLGGVSLKADRRLNIGKEIMLKLEEKGKTIDLKGVIVRSELSGIEENASGERVSVYTAGMMFNDGQAEKIINFFNFIMQGILKETSMKAERRISVRFQLTAPQEKVLGFPAQFMVKVISPGGMLIQTDQALAPESMVPMSLSLDADKTIDFVGRIASCSLLEETDQTKYEIGVEFKELTDADRVLMKTFIDYLAEVTAESEGGKSE